MAEMTAEQKTAMRKLLRERTYQGDAISAFRLFSGFVQGLEGFEKDLDKALEYLEISADLGFPHAIEFMKNLYRGKDVFGIKKEKDIKKYVEYLERMIVSDQLFDYTSVDEEERNKFYEMKWKAYAELGAQYIIDKQLYAEDNYKGYAISLYVAEEKGFAESLYALGYYFDCYRPPKYTPSDTLLKKRGNLGVALYYYERALNTDNSRYASLAFDAYNSLAEEINVNEGRTEETMIPYYQR